MYAIKTYRYLRIGMASLVVCLLASVGYEHFKNPQSCWQGSLSAYYYTPARPIFVAALFTIGVCMVVLLAYPPLHDVLLNVGGFLAVVVAVVPTPNKGSCMSVPFQAEERAANVANNMTAFFIGAAIAMIVTVATAFSERGSATTPAADLPGPGKHDDAVRKGGVVVEALLLVGGVLWFFGFRHSFDHNAHYVSAAGLCIAIIVLVVLNARAARSAPDQSKQHRYFLLYALLAGAMVVGAAVILVIQAITGWHHATLVLEILLIGCFGVFWGIQTKDLWNEAIRPAVQYRPRHEGPGLQ